MIPCEKINNSNLMNVTTLQVTLGHRMHNISQYVTLGDCVSGHFRSQCTQYDAIYHNISQYNTVYYNVTGHMGLQFF